MNNTLEQAWNDVASNLRGYIRTRVADHFAAEDILQDVYLKAHSRLGQPGHSNVRAWLFQIAKNAIIDHARKLRPGEELDESIEAERTDTQAEDAEKLKASFRQMILNLPAPYREAVTLADLDGLPQKEVAARLGISLSGAKSRVQRGREMLKRDLLECCELEFDRRGQLLDYKPKSACCKD